MKNFIIIIISLFFSTIYGYGQKNYSNEYEIRLIKLENGRALFTIYTYCKYQKECLEAAKIDAVKTVLFKGLSSSSIKIYPIIRTPNAEESFKKYFEKFFEPGGKYLQFIEFSDDDDVDYTVITKRKKKISMNIIVQREDLVKEMQNHKIIKLLDNGF